MLEYRIDNIPHYPTLFIRDGDFVYATNKETGEITNKLTLSEYADVWKHEYDTNPLFKKYYQSDLFFPKASPDTATTLKQLKALCSDTTRTGRGDTGYLVDFITSDMCTISEAKMLTLLSKYVDVWNYSVCTWNSIKTEMCLGDKQVKRIYNSLITKGLIIELTNRFDAGDEWHLLIKIHPKLFWKGRWSAFANAANEHYEYTDPVKPL